MTEVYNSDGITLHLGDNVEVMQQMPAASIDLVVTSPPYDNLRTYGGHPWDLEGVAQQLWRLIKPGGVVVWIVNDATIDGSETGTSFRQALRFMEIGFKLHDTMIYHRQGSFPMDEAKRYWQDFEYMFVLAKDKPLTFNPIKEKSVREAGSVIHQRRVVQKINGDARTHRVATGTKSLSNVWYRPAGSFITTDKAAFEHPAIFPESLARDHILSWSNEGDTVLDPFSGSGTTIKMARLMGRKGIGIEINPEYCEIAKERLRQKVLF
jgi:DNA modification methylase